MSYFEYAIAMWEDEEEKTYRGVVCGDCYSDAVQNIIDCFGENRITFLTIEAWDETNACLILSKEALKEVREQNV